jgi:phosphate transport system substrate-binding protein
MLKKIAILTIAMVCSAAMMSFTSGDKITIKGSDTMVILSQRWAEKFMSKFSDITVQVTGGGSGTGISALINGTTDICNSSRPMKPSEVKKVKERYGTMGVEIPCAKDGINIYLHPGNPVKNLTMQQLKDIYTGRITNWNQVGGNDARIILYSRENNSGTYVFFKEVVLGSADYAASCQNLPGTSAVVNAVSKDKNGIGYGGAAYSKGIKHPSINSIEPNETNIKTGKYPLSRNLFMYLKSKPTGSIKKFVDWVLSSEGQAVVKQVGYFSIN